MIDYLKYIVMYAAMLGAIWFVASLVGDVVSDYEVINPVDGVECVVVSRMFNTSVDCWGDE